MNKYSLYKKLGKLHLVSNKRLKKAKFKYELSLLESSEYFDADWYRTNYPDVKDAGIDPARHYCCHGWKEGRNPSAYFDTKAYLTAYASVKKTGMNPLLHYIQYGKNEGRMNFGHKAWVPEFKETKPTLRDTIASRLRTKNPKISVIVASYNYEQYIAETLDSLVAQTYRNFEVLVVDDGSRDHSVDLIRQYAQKYDCIKLLQHPGGENRGLIPTVLLGIEKAAGSYIAFCESDDYWSANHLEECVRIIRTYADTALISNDIELFGDPKRCAQMEKDVLNRVRARLCQTRNDVSYWDFLPHNYIPTFSCCMIRKDVLMECNFVDNPRPSATDWWLYRQILARGHKLFYIPQKLTFWRMHTSYNTTQDDDCGLYQNKFDEASARLCKRKIVLDNNAGRKAVLDVIRHSPHFNAAWYAATYHVEDIEPAAHYLYLGYRQGCNPSPTFDSALYLSLYGDELAEGTNPLLHYEQYGRHQNKVAPCMHDNPIDVLLLGTTQKLDGVYLWRINFIREYLEEHGYAVEDECLHPTNPPTLYAKIQRARLIIFSRPAHYTKPLEVMRFIRQLNKPFIIDTDDLLFARYAAYSGAVKSGNVAHAAIAQGYLHQSLCYGYADMVTTSTPLIAQEIEKTCRVKCQVVPNAISRSKVLSQQAPPHTDACFRLLYASGSITHEHDFSTIYLDILNIFAKYPDVHLTVLGRSNIASYFKTYQNRITVLPYCEFDEMLKVYARHDLLLVPLEDNPFNNAKSNIKYIEAGAVGVPVLAQSVAEFDSAITHRVNGFLYDGDFYQQFEYIYENRNKLREVGENARRDVLENHTDFKNMLTIVREILC